MINKLVIGIIRNKNLIFNNIIILIIKKLIKIKYIELNKIKLFTILFLINKLHKYLIDNFSLIFSHLLYFIYLLFINMFRVDNKFDIEF